MKVGSLVEFVGSPNVSKSSQASVSVVLSQGYVLPHKGPIYTVRGINHLGGAGLYLEEIVNPPIQTTHGFMEVAFCVTGFRELQPPMNVSELIEELLNEPQPC